MIYIGAFIRQPFTQTLIKIFLCSGVVPQDTVLFNNTIKYNIQYGKIDAPEADVISAAKNADIHERILTFPEAYETMVCMINY